MRKICFCGRFTGGGTERATFMVANKLNKLYKVYIINMCDNEPCFYLDKKINLKKNKSNRYMSSLFALIQFVLKEKIDVIITVEAMTGIYTIPASKLCRCKNIIWEHANYFQTQGSRIIQYVRQLELMFCDTYLVLTKRDKKNFEEHFKIKTRLEYIYNAIENVSETEYNADSKTIISAGHIRNIKNFSIIPDIGKIVFKKHPDWVWKIYGDGQGEEYDELVDKINRYGLSSDIKICGRTDNMDAVYKDAAIYVMTSLMEGLPMVLLEAKAHKVPIISFDIETGPDEIVRDGVNGYLVKPYSEKEMAERILNLIENRDIRHRFSDDSILGISEFDITNVVDKWIRVLDDKPISAN